MRMWLEWECVGGSTFAAGSCVLELEKFASWTGLLRDFVVV